MNYIDFTWSFTHDKTQTKNIVVYENGKITNLIRKSKYIYPYLERNNLHEFIMRLIGETDKTNLITFDLCTVFEVLYNEKNAVQIGGVVSIPHNLKQDTDIILDLLCNGIKDRKIKVVYINPTDNFITKEQANKRIQGYIENGSLETIRREVLI